MTTLRPRTAADVPALVEVVSAQQSSSGYPYRWPLPMPVEEFVVRASDEAAWVAEVDGRVVGHVAVARVSGAERDAFAAALAEAGLGRAGLGAAGLGAVSTLFVDVALRGHGIGGALLDRAVEHVRESGRTPVLDVLPTRGSAIGFYRRRGWRTVGEMRFDWLPEHEEPVQLMVLDSLTSE